MQPNKAYFRAEDHQLMTSLYVGKAKPDGGPTGDDLFDVATWSPATRQRTGQRDGCKLTWPS